MLEVFRLPRKIVWNGKGCGMKTLGNSNIQVIRRVKGSAKKDGQGTTGGKRIPGKKIKTSWEPERRESERRRCVQQCPML